jgi:hypothetical protein
MLDTLRSSLREIKVKHRLPGFAPPRRTPTGKSFNSRLMIDVIADSFA